MKRLIAIGISAALVGCATQKGNERHAQHAQDQIRMVTAQTESLERRGIAKAQKDAELYNALARVAESNPDHAPAVTVALAVIGVSGQNGGADGDGGNLVTLQQQRNEALEWTKALAPTVGSLVTGLGVAAINADVQKNASDNAAKVQINDAQSDVAIVEAVAGLGTAAANSIGVEVGGDYYSVTDEGSIDQSLNTTDSYNTTSTTETTTETTTTTSTEVSLNTTLNYDGQGMTLSDLITQLQNAGATYSIDLDGDGTPDVEGGEGEPLEITCTGFSPAPIECT